MNKLLLFCTFLLSLVATAEPIAYPVPNLVGCSGVFDLTVQTPTVLGNQTPTEFAVAYFLTEADAQANTNPIATPEMYVALSNEQHIFIRVYNTFNGNYALTAFWLITGAVTVPEFPDVSQCGSYTLPPLEIGHYYTQPGGQGDMLNPGFVLNNSHTIYIYASEGDCVSESLFHVTINPKPVLQLPINLSTCAGTTFNLANLVEQIMAYNDQPVSVHFYHTESDAANGTNAIENLQYAGTDGELIFIRVTNTETGCFRIEDFHLNLENCTASLITGVVHLDANNNGCNNEDPVLAGITVVAVHDNEVHYGYTNAFGEYHFTGLPAGVYQVYLAAGDQPFSGVMPEVYTLMVTGDSNSIANFCVTQAEYHDLGVQFYSSQAPIVGYNRGYILKVHNYGSVTASGTVQVIFDADKFSVVNSAGGAVSGNTITFTVNGLAAGATMLVELVLHVLEPPVANAGDAVAFTAQLEYGPDENPENNHVLLQQTLVSSLDPNDITVHEGAWITTDQAQGFLHYTVRFQNTGTAAAQNIRIENQLSNLLDWSTFRPVASSHTYFCERSAGEVTFRFPSIGLPAQSADESGSSGFITYEVKPVAGFSIGQIIAANANIFFDFNAAVMTNTVDTQIVNLGLDDASVPEIRLFPNPAHDQVFIASDFSMAEATLYDSLGKLFKSERLVFDSGRATLDISGLAAGIYLVRIEAQGKVTTRRLLVR